MYFLSYPLSYFPTHFVLLCAYYVPGTGSISLWDLIKVMEVTKVLLSISFVLTCSESIE